MSRFVVLVEVICLRASAMANPLGLFHSGNYSGSKQRVVFPTNSKLLDAGLTRVTVLGIPKEVAGSEEQNTEEFNHSPGGRINKTSAFFPRS